MENFNIKMKEYWAKAKAFFLKKWQGVPMYVWVFAPLLLIGLSFYFFGGSRVGKLKKSRA